MGRTAASLKAALTEENCAGGDCIIGYGYIHLKLACRFIHLKENALV